MKRNILFLLLILSLGVKAQSIRDYVYPSELKYDSDKGLLYFDVHLDGDNLYTAYGMDIKLSQGMTINTIKDRKGEKPDIIILQDGMYEDEYGDTEHSITPSFPTPEDYSHARVGCISQGNYQMGKTSGDLFRVYVKAKTPGWPIGTIKLYDVELANVGSHYNPADIEKAVIFISGDIELPLSVSSAHHWSTLVLPFSTSIPEGVTAYTCDEYTTKEESELLILKKAESFEAYTPYILYSEAGYSGTLSGTVDPANWPEDNVCRAGKLYGALATHAIGEGHFVLQNQGDGAKFYKIDSNDTFSIPAGKCYLGPDAVATKSFGFITEDEYETSISDVTKVVSDDIYTIQGVKVNEMLPGNIYIKGGKTILKLK